MPKIIDESNHKYFSLIPNILYEIGLSAFEISVYGAIKRCSGESSSCTKSYKNLSIHAGLSSASLKRILYKLSTKNKMLKKPLIKMKGRVSDCGDQDTNEIILVDLWMDNMTFFQNKNGELTQTSPQLTQTSPQLTQTSGVRSHRAEGEVCVSYEEEPFKKNPIKNRRDVDVSSFSSEEKKDSMIEENPENKLIVAKANKNSPKTVISIRLFKVREILTPEGYSNEEINEACDVLDKYEKSVSDIPKFLRGVIERKRIDKKQKENHEHKSKSRKLSSQQDLIQRSSESLKKSHVLLPGRKK